MNLKSTLGKKGETLVAQYLKKHGYTLVAVNYSVRGGEIDIIAEKKEVIAFVEVKMRSQIYFNLSEVVTISKQKKIIAAARQYIARHVPTQEKVYRFDVALVEPQNDDYAITYIPNAFTYEEGI